MGGILLTRNPFTLNKNSILGELFICWLYILHTMYSRAFFCTNYIFSVEDFTRIPFKVLTSEKVSCGENLLRILNSSSVFVVLEIKS